jgi:uncharacterized protein
MEQLIKKTKEFVRQNMTGYDSGHDWYHIDRVRRTALYINGHEKIADPFRLEIAALLHDMADSKFAGDDHEKGYLKVGKFLDETGLSFIREQVLDVIRNVSFSIKNPSGNLKDPVLLIIQDADRLDAIGAIGIARAFNYGGFRNNAIYIPGKRSDTEVKSTIAHFYDKLLKLKDMMNTETGKIIAGERHIFLEKFLEQFYKEWEFGLL